VAGRMPDEWHGHVPWDEIRAARSLLWWLISAPTTRVPSDLLPVGPTIGAQQGSGTATMTAVYPVSTRRLVIGPGLGSADTQ
jgi:hypothetical protein